MIGDTRGEYYCKCARQFSIAHLDEGRIMSRDRTLWWYIWIDGEEGERTRKM